MGRRFSHVVCKKADIDMTKRAGEMTDEEVTYFLRKHVTVDFLTSEHSRAQPVPHCGNFILQYSER